MPGEFRMYRRSLPHWRLDDAIYFVTWRLEKDQSPLTTIERVLSGGDAGAAPRIAVKRR
jgi:hypothetical protein